ncbi:hypothetical protein [Treponema phagedenis]|uniref:hypothetical protein n=1 Tax=Treponema phagedenis TaxID=162 RepID=UPI0012F8005A|nr:hypothetical protein [Treponema phagedenis]
MLHWKAERKQNYKFPHPTRIRESQLRGKEYWNWTVPKVPDLHTLNVPAEMAYTITFGI